VTTSILCPKCTVCGNQAVLEVSAADYERWLIERLYIQDAFPYLSADQRELLLTGTHPECWDLLFGTLDESEPMYA